MMETVADLTLFAHIAAGFAALASGPFAMFSRKGGRLHRRAGLVYVWAMVVVAATAAALAVFRPNVFLLGIAVLSFYLTFSGYRALYHKRLHRGVGVSRLDWAVSVATLLFGLGLVGYGTVGGFELLPVVFGLLTVALVGREFRRYTGRVEPGEWFFAHIVGMLSAYIATFTAFAVTNVTFVPPTAVWLAPTVIGSVGISLAVAHYKRRLGRNRRPEDVAEVRLGT